MKVLFSYSHRLFLLAGILILSLTGCENSPHPTIANELDSLTISEYPKVDGSTSAHPLQAIIACNLLGVDYTWMPSWFDETYRVWPVSEQKPEVAEFIRDSIVHNGTHDAYVNLITGKADIILVARTASADEIELAQDMEVALEETPIALDAFVFIANINNPVQTLSVQEIKDIYTGNISNWREVGGWNAEIHPYQRNPNSGSQELMLSLVMKDLQMLDLPDMILFGMMGPINMITLDHDGLGYTVYFFEQFMAPNDSLKLLAVEGVKPEYESLKNKQYIYTTEVFVVLRQDLDRSSKAYLMKQWLLSSRGQSVVDESGYIPYYYTF